MQWYGHALRTGEEKIQKKVLNNKVKCKVLGCDQN
jgi:hypothetical protein